MREDAEPSIDAERERVLQAFLSRYFEDEDRDALRSLEEYVAEFAGFENVIRGAWARLAGEAGPLDDGDVQPALQAAGFRVLREIGSGGQGRVYLARELALERLVAVKVLGTDSFAGAAAWTPRMRERFRREASLASRVQHPGICPVYALGECEGRPYLVMPFLSGETLQEALRDGPLPVARVLDIAESAALALHAAHEAGVIHRDVKASNLFLTEDGRTMLLDFGVAREEAPGEGLTQTGDVLGTLPFVSPEQLREETVDRRSDVYSLAVTAYEALTAELPFRAPTQHGLMNAIASEEATRADRVNPAIPRDLAVVLETGLEKDRARRYQSAEAFAEDLARVRDKRPIRARPAGFWRRAARFVQREPRLAGTILAAFLVLLAGLVASLVLLSRVRQEERNTRAALREIDMLTDRTRLEELLAEIPRFEPPRPDGLADMDAWLARGDALLARLPEHEAVLASLRENAREPDDEERAAHRARHVLAAEERRLAASRAYLMDEVARLEARADPRERAVLAHRKRELAVLDRIEPRVAERIDAARSFSFVEARERWRHELQEGLVASLHAFRDGDAVDASRARVLALRDFARTVRARSLEDAAEAWEACRAALRDAEACPQYGGLELAPQLGLVPLGQDPASGLFEFADLRSGEVPTRDAASGRLAMRPESGVVFVLVPGGRARLGASVDGATSPGLEALQIDANARAIEGPEHECALDPFFLSKFEVTQAQWVRWMRKNPSQSRVGSRPSGRVVSAMHPVEGVPWRTAEDCLRRYGFVFPTSAQWEYACRAGAHTVFATGDEPRSLRGFANIADRSWGRFSKRIDRTNGVFDDGFAIHAPIGSFRANGFGLHDMHGNVMEHCFDKEHRYSFHVLPGRGLRPIGGDAGRVLRGGSYRQSWRRTRCASFVVQRPDLSVSDAGLRPARLVTPAPKR